MEIRLSGISKKFSREWLFSDLNYNFHKGNSYAITGPNGSGKSTLIQLMAGYQLPTSGKVEWLEDETIVAAEEQYRFLSLATPYLELIEEFTLYEVLKFHFTFKDSRNNLSINELIKTAYFNGVEDKLVKNFSSGMKQRLKLLLALFSNTPVVFLDEPTTNMDSEGCLWYEEQMAKLKIPLVIIASNQPSEYKFCSKIVDISSFKPEHK